MVIAIDGPAGAGKVHRRPRARRALGFTYLDSGAMYRAVGLRPAPGGAARPRSRAALRIELGERGPARRRGRDRGDPRRREVSEAASRVAADPAVRAALVAQQRALLAAGDWVAEGRDIGTVVAPDAEVKVFLTASPEERARRRAAELGADAARRARASRRCATSATAAASTRRSRRPPTRSRLDTTGLSLEEVVDRIVTLAVEAKEIEAARHEEDRRRRLSERRQVLARQPPHAVPRGGRARDVGHHARPQGARRASGTGGSFALIDTGGVDLEDTRRSRVSIRDQARAALADARRRAARRRRARRDARRATRRWRTCCAAAACRSCSPRTRSTSPRDVALVHDFYSLGLGEPLAVSAAQGLGTGDLLDRLVELLPEDEEEEPRRSSSGSR